MSTAKLPATFEDAARSGYRIDERSRRTKYSGHAGQVYLRHPWRPGVIVRYRRQGRTLRFGKPRRAA